MPLQRTRSKFTKSDPEYIGYTLPGGSSVLSPGPVDWIIKGEVITDVVGNAFHFNPVSHVRLNSVPGGPGPFLRDYAFPPHTDTLLVTGVRLPFAYNSEPMLFGVLGGNTTNINEPVSLLDSNDAAVFTRSALDKALDQVPVEVSIANFIYELRDVKQLLVKLQGWKTLTDGFLSWNFGWLPLISDLKKLLTLVGKVRQRLEHLKRINRRTITISHSRTFVYTDGSTPSCPDVHPEDGEVSFSHTEYHEVKVTQHMSVSYDLDLHGADAFLQAMCSALGLMNPLSIIWNAIPFSFVVDWFINLGSFLDSEFGVAPFKGTIKIRSASCSFRTKTIIGHYSPSFIPILGPGTLNRFGSTLIRGYHRRHGTPEGTIDVTGLTPFQQALAAALIASNGNWRLPTRRRPKSR